MSKNKQSDKQVREIRAQAGKIVKQLNLAGENKAETAAILKGVQRGMEVFLKQQSERSRELDKKSKLLNKKQQAISEPIEVGAEIGAAKAPILPWVLLVVSWCLFVGYLIFEYFDTL